MRLMLLFERLRFEAAQALVTVSARSASTRNDVRTAGEGRVMTSLLAGLAGSAILLPAAVKSQWREGTKRCARPAAPNRERHFGKRWMRPVTASATGDPLLSAGIPSRRATRRRSPAAKIGR